jgi:hypothetical protein
MRLMPWPLLPLMLAWQDVQLQRLQHPRSSHSCSSSRMSAGARVTLLLLQGRALLQQQMLV